MYQIGPVGKGADEGQREPVAGGFAQAGLILHVVRHAALVWDGLVAAGKRNRLERKERNALGIVEGELDDAAHLLVIDAVDQRDDGHDVHAVGVQVFNRPQLYIKQVADFAVGVGGVADTIELQVGITQTGVGGL